MYREWLDLEEFKASLGEITKVINDNLKKDIEQKTGENKNIKKRLNMNIDNNNKNIIMYNYG